MRGLLHAAVIFSLLPASLALAQAERPTVVEGDVSLDYRRGSSASACPDEATFRERAADAFDFHDPFVAAGAPAAAHMRVEITGRESGFLGTMFVVDAAGKGLATATEQHLNCDALVWALSHRTALAIRRARSAPPPPAPPPPAPPPPPARPPPLAAPRPAPCEERCAAEIERRPARSNAMPGVTAKHMAGAVMTMGLTSEPGWGVWLGTAAQIEWVSIAFEGRAVLPQTIPEWGQGKAAAAAVSGLFVPCVEWRFLSMCGVVEVGALLFSNPGRPDRETVPLISAGPRLGVAARFGPGIALRAFVELDLHPSTSPWLVERNVPGDRSANLATATATGTLGAAIVWSR